MQICSKGKTYYELHASSFATKNGTSNEYVTVYTGTTASSNYIKGDATYETNGLNSDVATFMNSYYPFFMRSGYYGDKDNIGYFYCDGSNGLSSGDSSFRTVLAIK